MGNGLGRSGEPRAKATAAAPRRATREAGAARGTHLDGSVRGARGRNKSVCGAARHARHPVRVPRQRDFEPARGHVPYTHCLQGPGDSGAGSGPAPAAPKLPQGRPTAAGVRVREEPDVPPSQRAEACRAPRSPPWCPLAAPPLQPCLLVLGSEHQLGIGGEGDGVDALKRALQVQPRRQGVVKGWPAVHCTSGCTSAGAVSSEAPPGRRPMPPLALPSTHPRRAAASLHTPPPPSAAHVQRGDRGGGGRLPQLHRLVGAARGQQGAGAAEGQAEAAALVCRHAATGHGSRGRGGSRGWGSVKMEP